MREEDVGKRVGIWIRVSPRSIDQRKGQDAKSESPELHQKRAELYAEMKGWEVAGVYRLIDVSGKDVAHHPETRRMLSDVKRGIITGLIFSKLARLGRKTDVLIQILDTFREHGADLISLDESIDTSTPAGRNFFRFMASNAEWEREEIAERMQKSIEIRAKLGKQISGAAPFGYRWEKGVLLVDPAEAPVRKLIYELYLKHKRKGTVARLLNEAGYRTRAGGEFHPLAVERLILDPTSKGIHRRNYTTRAKDNKATLLKPESEWELVEVEPIVSEEVWEEAVALLNANRQPQKVKRGRPAVQLFGGLVFCGKCGEKMYVKSNNPKYICPKCGNKIPKGDLEFVFKEQLHAFALSPEQVSAHLADADTKARERIQLLEQLTREEAQLSRQMEKTYRLYLDDQLSPESFGKLYRPLEERAAQLAEEIPRLQAEVDFARMQHLSRAELVAEGESLYARWDSLETAEKRAIVEAITERVEVNGDEIEIRLCYLPPPQREELAKNTQSPPPRTAHPAVCRSSKALSGRRLPAAEAAATTARSLPSEAGFSVGWRGFGSTRGHRPGGWLVRRIRPSRRLCNGVADDCGSGRGGLSPRCRSAAKRRGEGHQKV